MTNATGGCLCGDVRFELASEPVFHFACHCTDCQRTNGGAPTLGVAVPQSALTVTHGAPKDFSVAGDSGREVRRSFCDTCGSPLFSWPEAMPGMVVIKVGALDDPSLYKPQIDMFMASARPWHAPHEGAAQFDRSPS